MSELYIYTRVSLSTSNINAFAFVILKSNLVLPFRIYNVRANIVNSKREQ